MERFSHVAAPASAPDRPIRCPRSVSALVVSIPLAVLGTLSACCAGCGSGEEPAQVVLRVANWGSPAVETDFMKLEREIWDEFERTHPGVKLQIEQIPGPGQYAPKVLMMHLTGSVPDVIHLDASSAAIFINNDVLLDLAPFVKRDTDFDLDRFFENVLKIYQRGSRVYSIPLDFTPMVMYYNKTLFDEANVPYPRSGWTWDDFLRKAEALTKPPPPGEILPQQYGFYFENIMPFWVLWLWTNGGDVLSPDGRRASGYLDGPRSVEAVQFLVDLMEKHHVAPTLREKSILGVNPFLEGQAAMDLKGHWMMIDYRARGLDVGVVELPRTIEKPVTVVYAAGLSIMQKAEHPDLAWEYIKFMTGFDVQRRRVESGLAISGNKVVADSFAGDPTEDAFLRLVQYARPPWGAYVERYPFIEDLGTEMMSDLLHAGGANVEAELRRTARLIDAALKDQ
jgi:multiple sugar transport system substrate-binding protein